MNKSSRIAFSVPLFLPLLFRQRENVAEFRDRFHCWDTVSMTETKRGKRTSNGKHWFRKERGTGQGRRHRGDPCTCRASPVWNRVCPSPRTRSSPRPPPKNPRMDEIKRAVLRSSSSPPLLSRPPSSCLFACLFADSDHWAFLEKPCRAVFPPVFLRSCGKKKKERKKEERRILFLKELVHG